MLPTSVDPNFINRARRSWEMSLSENATRLCHTYATVHSTGWGQYLYDTPFYFDAIYQMRPFVHYGYAMDGETINDGGVPRCTGGVHRWIVNDKKQYLGAFVMVTVDLAPWYQPPSVGVSMLATDVDENGMPPGYNIDHFFYFAGVGSKNLPYADLER